MITSQQFAAGLVAVAAVAGGFVNGDLNRSAAAPARPAQAADCLTGAASRPALSAGGANVAFVSRSDRLGNSGRARTADVFARNLAGGAPVIASRASGPAGNAARGDSGSPSVSADGRFVAFHSSAPNLVPRDRNRARDVFVRDLVANTTRLVSRASGPRGAVGDRASGEPSISGDGRFVAFESAARNLSALDGAGSDVFVRDLRTGRTTLVSRGFPRGSIETRRRSHSPAMSLRGRSVAFASFAPTSDKTDTDAAQVWVRELGAGRTTLVSQSERRGRPGDYGSSQPSISEDGNRVAFVSRADNLSSDKPRSEFIDMDAEGEGYGFRVYYDGVFVRDIRARTTTLVSRADGARGEAALDGEIAGAVISSDGRFVAFSSDDWLAPGPDPRQERLASVFVRDVDRQTTVLIDARGVPGSISADGSVVAFTRARATRYGITRGDVFVRDVGGGESRLVSGALCEPAPEGPAVIDATAGLERVAAPGGCIFSSLGETPSEHDAGVADGSCTMVEGLDGPRGLVFTPDGRHGYLVTAPNYETTIKVLERDPATGGLREVPGAGGCIGPTRGCAPARGWRVLGGFVQLHLSPDGRTVYAVGSGILAFARDPATGGLTQLPGKTGCLATGRVAGCGRLAAPAGDVELRLAPDGRSGYLLDELTLTVLRRDRHGALFPRAGKRGCFAAAPSAPCTRVAGMPRRSVEVDFTLARGGRFAYLGWSNFDRGAIVAFRRGGGGALRPVGGRSGCVADGRVKGCRAARGLSSLGLVASPDGRNLHATSIGIATFRIDAGTGVLRQLRGRDGCIGSSRARGCRWPGPSPDWVGLSPDGRSAYVVRDTGKTQRMCRLVRHRASGALRPARGSYCGRALPGRSTYRSLMAHDGTAIYLMLHEPEPPGSFAPGGVLGLYAYRRDPATGDLTALSGRHGCLSGTAHYGCSASPILAAEVGSEAIELTFGPSDRHVYVVAGAANAIIALARVAGNAGVTRRHRAAASPPPPQADADPRPSKPVRRVR